MPLIINGRTYYRTAEVCRKLNMDRSTILRWFKVGTTEDVSNRDWRGWRLFTNSDIKRIKSKRDCVV